MTARLDELFSLLPPCSKFADVGCDHGYIAQRMLLSGKCGHAVISDISEKCLKKAETLLKGEIEAGRATAVVSDGLEQLPADCDLALIAGMGGEEIVEILKRAPFLPATLCLQPMKNAEKLRVALMVLGYRIEKDYTFRDGKFYDAILAVRGEDRLSAREAQFGRTNLNVRPPAFLEKLQEERGKIDGYLERDLSAAVRGELLARRSRLTEIIDEDI